MVEKTRRSVSVLRRCQESDREELNYWRRRSSEQEDPRKGGSASAPFSKTHSPHSAETGGYYYFQSRWYAAETSNVAGISVIGAYCPQEGTFSCTMGWSQTSLNLLVVIRFTPIYPNYTKNSFTLIVFCLYLSQVLRYWPLNFHTMRVNRILFVLLLLRMLGTALSNSQRICSHINELWHRYLSVSERDLIYTRYKYTSQTCISLRSWRIFPWK